MNTKLIATVSAIAGLMIAGSSAWAAPARQTTPQPPAPNAQTRREERRASRQTQRDLLEGRIQSIAGNTITLRSKNLRDSAGAVFAVDGSTKYLVPGVSNATLANVKAGDRVAVLFSGAPGNTPRIASAVSVLPLPASAVVGGTVSNVTATGFTLTGPRGNSGTVNTAGAKVIVPGKTSAALDYIQNGMRVAVQGEPAGDANIDATLIVVAPQNRDNVFAGVIAAIDGSTLTLFTRDGQQAKVDASSAVIFERGENAATLADLKAGRAVAVIGIKNADGSVTAQFVGQATMPFFRR
jgi:hypothetical protein